MKELPINKIIKSPYQRVKEWRLRNKDKRKAQMIIFSALRNGTLKKEKCFCGKRKVEAHHEDYSLPLNIIWLCKKHHIEADINRRNLTK